MYITTLYHTEVQPVRYTMHAAAPFDWPAIAPASSYAWPHRNLGFSYHSTSLAIILLAIASPVSPVLQAWKQRNRLHGVPLSSTKRMLINSCSVFATSVASSAIMEKKPFLFDFAQNFILYQPATNIILYCFAGVLCIFTCGLKMLF